MLSIQLIRIRNFSHKFYVLSILCVWCPVKQFKWTNPESLWNSETKMMKFVGKLTFECKKYTWNQSSAFYHCFAVFQRNFRKRASWCRFKLLKWNKIPGTRNWWHLPVGKILHRLGKIIIVRLIAFLPFFRQWLSWRNLETSKPGYETASQSGQHDEVCR